MMEETQLSRNGTRSLKAVFGGNFMPLLEVYFTEMGINHVAALLFC